MKLTLYSAIGMSLVLASCSTLDPEYAEYKKQKEAEAVGGAQSPYAPAGDPYGVPGTETGNYAPYQPLPGVNDSQPPSPDPLIPLGTPTPGINAEPTPYPDIPTAPIPGTDGTSVGPTVSHTVVKGDSLWGLSRRYNTSVEAIKAANGLSGDTIQTGRTLQIPSNN